MFVFLGIRIASSAIINSYYLSEEKKAERTKEYVDELQAYVDENKLTAQDTDKLASWARKNRYLYVLVYKDDQLLFESGDLDETKPDDDGGESPETGEGGNGQEGPDSENTDDKKYPDTGSLTVQVPSREELIKYASEKGSHIITIGEEETPLLVSMADFSEYFYYDMSNILALFVGMLILILFIMLFFGRVTRRISKLCNAVTNVAEGNIDCALYEKGRDEISRLYSDVDNMRRSLVESIAKERETMDANTQLITSMSHDIRTPLTVLLGYLDVMKKHSDDPDMQEYLRASEKTALRLKGLSDDMFNYFLVFGGEFGNAELKEYDASTLYYQLLAEHVLLLQEKGYKVEFNLGEFSGIESINLKVVTDPNKLVRVVENIFSNIYKYADKAHPVSICLEKIDEKIKLKFTNKISNDGERRESSGIGLKTCRKLCELLGIDFEEQKSEAEFSVTMYMPFVVEGSE